MELRTYQEFTRSIINTLEMHNISYAIGGSFASSSYGEARPSIDIDISVAIQRPELDPLVTALQELGYYITWDSILDALVWRTPFNVIDPGTGYKADFFLVEPSLLEESILERRKRIVYDTKTGDSAFLYSPEDVIIYKLKYYMDGRAQKHPRDILAMLVVQGQDLDYMYISHWARDLGAQEIWDEILNEYHRRTSKA